MAMTSIDDGDGYTAREIAAYVRRLHPEPEQVRQSTMRLTEGDAARMRHMFGVLAEWDKLTPAQREFVAGLAEQLAQLSLARDTTLRTLARDSGVAHPWSWDASVADLPQDDEDDAGPV